MKWHEQYVLCSVCATEFAVSSENIGEDDQIPCFSNVCNTHPEDVTEFSSIFFIALGKLLVSKSPECYQESNHLQELP